MGSAVRRGLQGHGQLLEPVDGDGVAGLGVRVVLAEAGLAPGHLSPLAQLVEAQVPQRLVVLAPGHGVSGWIYRVIKSGLL